MTSKVREGLKLAGILFWLIFTVVFALWWLKFSLENIATLAQLQPDRWEHWGRLQRMVVWEGTSWIILLAIGGLALISLVQRERGRVHRIREFFASFSHEVKTSLASLRLQAEALKDDQAQPHSPILDRLIGDTVRLQVQLENSLFLASQESLQLYLQPLALRELIERMREQWPELKIEMSRSCRVFADERAMRTILSNLLQNALVHGGATQIEVKVEERGTERLAITVVDNGRGLAVATAQLGQLFHRPASTSGSGLGLYICGLLLTKMQGSLDFKSTSGGGFSARMELKGAVQ